jgi:KaiC/GvpD/RAD55 family RecA-like ATPase
MTQKNNLSKNLEKLKSISEWFESRDDVDVEEGLQKVKEAVEIIKESRKRLKDIENDFEKVKKELDDEE